MRTSFARDGVALIAGAVALLLAACAPATPGETPAPTALPPTSAPTAPAAAPSVTLQFWTVLPDQSVTDKELDTLVRAFQQEYPAIRIVVSSQPTATELYRRVVASVAAGTLPDLVSGSDADLAQYARTKSLAPLDDYIADPANGLSAAELADIPPALQETMRPGDPDNKVYSLPYARGVMALYYDWSAMKAIGITNTPRTWDEFRLHARTLTKNSVRGFAYRPEASVFEALLMSRGGSLFDAKLTKATFNAPAGVDALAYLGDGVKEGWIYRAAAPADMNDFVAGRTIFTIASTTMIPAYQQAIDAAAKGGKAFEWGVAALPQTDNRKATAILDGANIALMRGTPDKMQAAWLFMRWLMREKTSAAWTQMSGAAPARGAARDLLKDYFVRVPAQKQAIDDLLPLAHPSPIVRSGAEIRQLIESAIAAFESGKSAPNIALDDAAGKATALLNAK